MKNIKFPVMNVKMIPIEKIEANDYNPNKVASPEMKLLKLSIEKDGYTQPVVVYYDSERDKYIIVDGFHRYTCAIKYFDLKEIPCTIIDKPLEERKESTIRHNRARGTHQIINMSAIVVDLLNSGYDEEKICKNLGMDLDEVIRLKSISALDLIVAENYSKSWDEFISKFDDEEDIE